MLDHRGRLAEHSGDYGSRQVGEYVDMHNLATRGQFEKISQPSGSTKRILRILPSHALAYAGKSNPISSLSIWSNCFEMIRAGSRVGGLRYGPEGLVSLHSCHTSNGEQAGPWVAFRKACKLGRKDEGRR